jgi:hypothetical protein
MKTFDALSPRYWLPTFIPGVVLAFDIIILYDLFTIRAMSPFINNSPAYWIFLAVLSLTLGPTLSFIVHMTVKSPAIKWIVEQFCIISGMRKRGEPVDAFFVIGTFFSNMVIPAAVFGFLFPDYLNLHFLQPFFCFELLGASFLFAVLALFALALVEYE